MWTMNWVQQPEITGRRSTGTNGSGGLPPSTQSVSRGRFGSRVAVLILLAFFGDGGHSGYLRQRFTPYHFVWRTERHSLATFAIDEELPRSCAPTVPDTKRYGESKNQIDSQNYVTHFLDFANFEIHLCEAWSSSMIATPHKPNIDPIGKGTDGGSPPDCRYDI
jgi:hypothetical protein